ncbi:MAG: T9SS type A sorting domain-containing protein [Flavobacteriaceae bacterium]|nr:T9SS type A sorting domain-containing protein [Flavobacteriaceae bacterium]
MKKITLLIAIFAMTVTVSAQDSVTEAIASGINVMETAGQQGSYIINRGNRLPVVGTYTDRFDYEDACVGTLVMEDVAGGPGAIAACDETISSAAGSCFAAGEIIEELIVTIGQLGVGQTTVYADAGSGFPNVNPVIGSNTFPDYTVIEMTGGQTSIGFDVIALTTGADIEVRVFGTGGMIDSFSIDATSGGDIFIGMIADEAIVSVELEDLSSATAELIAMISIGDCTILSVNENLISQIAVFPNPTNDILNIKVPSTVEVLNSSLYNLLGQDTGLRLVNGTMNTNELAEGVYILNVETSAGTLTQKVVKQ